MKLLFWLVISLLIFNTLLVLIRPDEKTEEVSKAPEAPTRLENKFSEEFGDNEDFGNREINIKPDSEPDPDPVPEPTPVTNSNHPDEITSLQYKSVRDWYDYSVRINDEREKNYIESMYNDDVITKKELSEYLNWSVNKGDKGKSFYKTQLRSQIQENK